VNGQERIGHVAADLMESVEHSELPDGLTNPRVRTVAVVVEIETDSEDPDEPGTTEVFYRCSDQRRWVQIGFFEAAQRAVLNSA
jgi:hypothetical protein